MTIEEITSMAREAGFVGFDGENKCLREFATLVAAAAKAEEREACAKVCESMRGECWAYDHDRIAAAIRARSNT